jgi:hypothetical protein
MPVAGRRAASHTDFVVVGPRPKQDDGHPKQRLNRLVGLVYALAVGPGLVLNKPPFRLSVVGPRACHNVNAYRPIRP